MRFCVTFGWDCTSIAIYLIIGYWNQVRLGCLSVLKSINGLLSVVVTRAETVDIFGNALIVVV